jgi:cell shape-determining protein MreC
MSLYNFIVKLRKKPDHKKKQVLIFLLAVSFIILAVFWVTMFKRDYYNVSDSGQKSDSAVQYGDDVLSPLAALVDGFKNFKKDFSARTGDLFNNVKKDNAPERPVYELPVE